ncbi:ankyrin repeat domain-containing protein [Hydrogenophaga sp. PAMC20947]|uniref:ankyrin repeat domain-containing protein n=1 Tax=Hydrogenophaga sp. PAMC20947 TaxID=2565558 RepID=UPI00109DE08C|nr:ankyrin repeat domain-containing protein [Hydrogenophaga sp. PAMC20947]QCB47035.1 ankyrin repeat domain-containing protein [Hydrogenophaga sp. PAMC20947]
MSLKPSQRSTRAGSGAGFLTLFTLIWNAMVWGLLVPDQGAPVWFKAVFVVAGALVAWATIVSWRDRLRGGGVSLRLEEDPVPHGVPTTAYFTLRKPLALQIWTLDVVLDTAKGPQSGFGRVWEGSFPATTVPSVVAGEIVVQDVKVEFNLPADLPSTQDKDFRATLVLKGDDLSWQFDFQTRPGTATELTFHSDERAWGSAPIESPREAADAQSGQLGRGGRLARLVWVRRGVQLLTWGVFAWFAWDFVQPVLREVPAISRFVTEIWSQGRAEKSKVLGHTVRTPAGEGLNAEGDTSAFPITISNWLIDDWRYRAHLEGTAQVQQGTLRVRIDRLQLMPVNACKGPDDCQITGVGLLLSQDAGGSFHTLSQSENLPWTVNLGEVGRAVLRNGEFVLPLPKAVPATGDVRLKLVVQAARKDPETGKASASWVYPSHGNHLALQAALMEAGQTLAEPCDQLLTAQAAVQASCHARLAVLMGGSMPFSQQALDGLLIEAILHFNAESVPLLLEAGASANATQSSRPSHSALGLAAAGNQMETVRLLVAAGADVNHQAENDQQQIVTPLTQALRRDAALAVAQLLQAGASLHNNDLNGWTVMHIAAFEGATESMAALVEAGGNVNQKTAAYRQQTAFHTALQFAPLATIETMLSAGADTRIADDQGENACGWAKFFHRSAPIQALVCGA